MARSKKPQIVKPSPITEQENPNRRTASKQADGINDTAEDRAAHIARRIGECAQAMGVEPCDISWWDFRAYGQVAWGENSLGIVRRDITRLGGYNAIRDAYHPPTATDHAVTRKRLREHSNINRRLGAHATAEAFQFKQIETFASRVFKGRIEPVEFKTRLIKKRPGQKYSRALVISLGDMHWGADLVKEETGSVNYGRIEEARGLAEVVRQTCQYKLEHRDDTELHVVLLGDFIHGCLHDLRDGAVLAEQQSRAIHLLIQAVGQFSAAFPKVFVHCVTGNHGRDKTRHQKPATSGKWDSRETTIYSAVRMATRSCKNVEWFIPRSAFCVFKLFGKKYFVTHGDSVIRVGNPGQSINVAELERQVNRLNATLRDRDEYVVVIVGHVHQALELLLSNGVTVIVNGPGTPVDPFAVSIGVFECVCSQQLFEVVEGHPVGDSRKITIDANVYADATLDKVIEPWTGF